MAVNYFKKIGARRLLIMIMGNVFLGMGISIFKLSGLGNDPFSGMVMALANILASATPLFCWSLTADSLSLNWPQAADS